MHLYSRTGSPTVYVVLDFFSSYTQWCVFVILYDLLHAHPLLFLGIVFSILVVKPFQPWSSVRNFDSVFVTLLQYLAVGFSPKARLNAAYNMLSRAQATSLLSQTLTIASFTYFRFLFPMSDLLRLA